ncbi:MAG: PAS domain S-box protein, partial [Deltaproteobacteria bacterium]|nr:PAS domain S-box protein [Deltaproteobacteria bacterium]
ERDLSLAQRIGDQIAGAIANAQIYDDLKRAEQEMAVIAEISRLIGSTLDIEAVYERFAAETRKLIPFDSLIVNLMAVQPDCMQIAYASGLPLPRRHVGQIFPVAGTLAEAIMHARPGTIIQSHSPEELVSRFPSMVFSIQVGILSVLGVPLISNDEVIGTLIFRSKAPEAYKGQDLRLAEKIGAQIAGAMANAQLYANLKKTEHSLRESEEKYRELVEFLPISVFEIDQGKKIASFNHTALETFGYGPKDPIKEMEASRFIVPGEWKRLTEDMQEVMDGASRSSVEYRFIRKDGSTFTGLIYASPILRQGKPTGIRGAIIDITDRIKATEELQKAKTHLLQSEKLIALGRLSAGVAHEILNPVNIISLALQILLRGNELSPQAKQKIGICTDQIRRIVTIAEDLKRFSYMKENRLAMGDMAAAVDQVLELSLPQLKINGIKTEVQHPDDLPTTLMDRERLEQVILNLLTNAAAAMEGKKEKVLRIAIGRGATAEGRDCLRVTIADTGTGICKEDMTRIFEPFYTTKAPGKGTGLGLSISFSIIQDHSGRIWAENNEWGGASFYFEIPIITNEAVAAFQAKERLHGENSCSR